MKKRQKIRRMTFLMRELHPPSSSALISFYEQEFGIMKALGINSHFCKNNEFVSTQTQIFILGEELGMTFQSVLHKWNKTYREHLITKPAWNLKYQMPKETKDNNGVYVGSGYGGGLSSIRYPSKKRSKKVWQRFYELFPILAERDEWDGKTSKRMK